MYQADEETCGIPQVDRWQKQLTESIQYQATFFIQSTFNHKRAWTFFIRVCYVTTLRCKTILLNLSSCIWILQRYFSSFVAMCVKFRSGLLPYDWIVRLEIISLSWWETLRSVYGGSNWGVILAQDIKLPFWNERHVSNIDIKNRHSQTMYNTLIFPRVLYEIEFWEQLPVSIYINYMFYRKTLFLLSVELLIERTQVRCINL